MACNRSGRGQGAQQHTGQEADGKGDWAKNRVWGREQQSKQKKGTEVVFGVGEKLICGTLAKKVALHQLKPFGTFYLKG